MLEGIARALAVPEAVVGWDVLLRMYENNTDNREHGLKVALGFALSGAADEALMPDLQRLIRDRSAWHGAQTCVASDVRGSPQG